MTFRKYADLYIGPSRFLPINPLPHIISVRFTISDLPSFLQPHDGELISRVVSVSIDLVLSSCLFLVDYLSSLLLMVSFRGFSIPQCSTYLVDELWFVDNQAGWDMKRIDNLGEVDLMITWYL